MASGKFLKLPLLAAVFAAEFVFAAGRFDNPSPWFDWLRPAAISGDPEQPRRHFRVSDAADLTAAQATTVYDGLGAEMRAAYQKSGHAVALVYRDWQRYNTTPYLSATHGRRYVNNYANETARAYGAYEDAGVLPVGSVIAKDSFEVTTDGRTRPGPLFMMEKMPAGFNYVSGDWRYAMIMPDGSIFGVTKGDGSERVDYCIGCHLAKESQDHLYFIPEGFRIRR